MTIDEFCERLAKVRAHWFLRNGSLRCYTHSSGGDNCPISAVTGNSMDFWDASRAGARLGLSSNDARSIVAAADGNGYLDIRTKLLKAVGLEE